MNNNPVTLANLTTFGVGGPARRLLQTADRQEFVSALQQADTQWRRAHKDTVAMPSGQISAGVADDTSPGQNQISPAVLVLGGGSNLVARDEPFPGLVLQDQRSGIDAPEALSSACGGATVRVPAGQNWDELVAFTVENDLMGIEALSGIPGTCGAAPVQNIGAYGQELAQALSQVRVWDRVEGRERSLALAELNFAYRDSILKRSRSVGPWLPSPSPTPTGRWVVLEVELQLRHASLSRPVAYQQLADALGVELGARVPLRDLRAAVLDLRRSKGMVYDPADADTHSAGSFFTNPIIPVDLAASLPPEAPRFPVRDTAAINSIAGEAPVVEGVVKTSAAWLIQHSGLGRGFALPGSRAALSGKHVLAITNRGGASALEVRQLAEHVIGHVQQAFGITLVPEPIIL